MEDAEFLRGMLRRLGFYPTLREVNELYDISSRILARDAEIARLRDVLQDAMARPDEISSDLMDVFAAALASTEQKKEEPA